MSENQTKKKNQQRSRRAREEWLPALIERFPQTFFGDPKARKPLKIGVHKDILALDDNKLAAYQLTSALRWYTGALGYQLSIKQGEARIDLQGEASGEVSAEDESAAAEKIKAIRERMKQSREQKAQDEKSDRWMKKLSRITT